MIKRMLWAILASFAIAGAASAANPKGVAAVILPNWTTPEADLLVKTVGDAKVPVFEVSFWATYDGTNGYGIPQRVVNGLLARNVKVQIRVFLGGIHDMAANPNLWSQGDALNAALVVPYRNNGNVSWRISPSLEDAYPDQTTWEGAAKAVLKRLDTAIYPRLRMLRCTTQTRSGLQISIPATVNSGAGNVTCESECHWTTRVGSASYSNDGQFVYIGSELFSNSATPFAGSKLLTVFKKVGINFGGSQILWSPSYNLHRSDQASANRKFDGSQTLSERLKARHPAFDAYEAAVLKSFLQ